MPRTRDKINSTKHSAESHWTPEILTRLAMFLALAIVIARLTYHDAGRFRDEGFSVESARGSTTAGAIQMDLLACLPAILVLARRVSDKQYVVRWSWALLPMMLLAGWSALSILWSADKFGALLGASRWIGATALLWAGVQLVRSWLRLRLVASIAAGLLLALFMHALLFQLLDVQDLRDYWTKYRCTNPNHANVKQDGPGVCPKDGLPLVSGRQALLADKGWSESDFLFQQFERKVLSGEAQGFSLSANTFAAVTVVLMLLVIGMAGQRLLDDRKDQAGWGLLVLVPLGAWILYRTGSMTSAATWVLGTILLLAAWRFRARLALRWAKLFWIAAGLFALGAAAIVGHGLKHHTLFHTSLTFRWHYWTGAMRAFAQHPVQGVGAENFGLHYLRHRLPEAPEEVKDPHNFLVKFLVELGIVGALLAIAWMGRMWWELARPVVPAAPDPHAPPKRYDSGIRSIALICGAGILLSILASVDFASRGNPGAAWFVFQEILKRVLLLAMLIIGTTVAAVRSLKDQALDDRPAPLLLYAIICGLGMFLLHNTIDFSLFEPGPLLLFSLLAGAALGVRQPSIARKKKRTPAAAVALGVTAILWLAAVGFVWLPTLLAEDAAADALAEVRNNNPYNAATFFARAYEYQPLEADFPYRAGRSLASKKVFDPQVQGFAATAIRTNPMAPEYYLLRARYLLRSAEAAQHQAQIESDYKKVLELNPNAIDLHIEFGDALASFNTPQSKQGALGQYREALILNDRLKPNEPRKLTGKGLSVINDRIERLQNR